jgi:hypothetical protein
MKANAKTKQRDPLLDEAIHVKVGADYRHRLEQLVADDPDGANMSMVVRRVLRHGFEHMEACIAATNGPK